MSLDDSRRGVLSETMYQYLEVVFLFAGRQLAAIVPPP